MTSMSSAGGLSSPGSMLKIISSRPDGQQIVTTKPIILTTTSSEKGLNNSITTSTLAALKGGNPLTKQYVKFVVRPSSPGVQQPTTKKTIVLNDTKPYSLTRSNTDSALMKPGVIRTIQTVSHPGVVPNRSSSPSVMGNGSTVVRSASFQLPKNDDPMAKMKMPFYPSTSQVS